MIHRKKIGPLDCTVVGALAEDRPSRLLVVLCHGFGAPGTDLVPLAEEIIGASNRKLDDVTFLFPEAPLGLDAIGGFEGRAWWMINMQALSDMMGARDFSDLRSAVPPGIIEAREMLNETLAEALDATGLSWGELVIGGFSQGAMLTTEVVLNAEQDPRALVAMSGTLICEEQWREKVTHHAGLRVIQSHGRIDPVLPFEAAEWLRDLFVENGCEVRFLPFHGVHTIPMEMLDEIRQLIESSLD